MKKTYIILFLAIISIISLINLTTKNPCKESYIVLQNEQQTNIYAIDNEKHTLKKIDNVQVMIGVVIKLEGVNENNVAVIHNKQRKCDYSVDIKENSKVNINDKLIVFYSGENSKLISPGTFTIQYGYIILKEGE